jgi:hypothetical protein
MKAVVNNDGSSSIHHHYTLKNRSTSHPSILRYHYTRKMITFDFTALILILTILVSTLYGEVIVKEDEDRLEPNVVTTNHMDNTVEVDTMGEIVTKSTTGITTTTSSNTTQQQQQRDFTSADMKCRIWLAPSTLQGAGLGMFAGTNFHPEEEFLVNGDITIAITDIGSHNSAPGQVPYGTFLWDEYTWSAHGLKMDQIGYQQNIASEGFGSAANSFLPVYNVDEWAPRITYANALHRSRDPGVGAFTQYHHRLSTSRRYIEAGEELYVSCTYHFYCFFVFAYPTSIFWIIHGPLTVISLHFLFRLA